MNLLRTLPHRAFPFLLTSALIGALSIGCGEVPTSLLDGDGDGTGGSGSVQSGTTGQTNGSSSSQGGSTANGTGGEAPQPATYEITLSDTSPDLELRATVDVDVSIAANGYVGPVSLSVGGAPADVTAALDTPSVTLSGSGTATAVLTLTTQSDTVTGSFPLTVTGTVPSGTKSGAATLTVQPIITITIPKNLASFSASPANKTAFGPYPTTIKALPNMSASNTISVRFFNADTAPHEIHADNATEGFGHGNGDIAPMSFDGKVRDVNTPGTYDFYPHDIGTSILGRIVIQ